MPSKPKRPCSHPRCPNLTTGSYCDEHIQKQKEKSRDYDKQRGTRSQRGYDYRWSKARETFLNRNPLCVHCEDKGTITPANVVDHIIPHKGDRNLFWDKSNWQSLCASCHSKKTVKEDGGFGKNAL